ncbi:DUF3078 domain-containing protein [Oceanihabitans sediminis]|uniref:DUF3078 domain-containing protein n=1 Tax=Oceanihabitans sediminis TaxID=1812012 RepID=UPI003A9533DA
MRKVLFFVFIFVVQFAYSQYDIAESDSLADGKKEKKLPSKWSKKNVATLDVSEVAFVNWNSGGSNSISALLGFASQANYKYKNFYWNNNLKVRYGVNKQQDQELRKTEDVFEVNSNVGYRRDTLSNWFFTSRFNFKTQFTSGYSYPNTDTSISKLMAPGYLFYGMGFEYGKNIETLSLYFSPATLKSTFVLDQRLANSGAFGVTAAVYDAEGNLIREGSRVRTEFGILFTNAYETEIATNIYMKHLASFYTDYINDFGNIDVDWQVNLDFKVNSYIRANLGSHLKFDNDVRNLIAVHEEGEEEEYVEEAAKIQWKQILGIGVVFDF